MFSYQVFSRSFVIQYRSRLLSETTVFYLLWSVAFRFLIPLAIVWNMDGFWLKYNSFNEMPDVQFKKQLILVLDGYSQMEPNILKQFSYTSFPTMSKAFNLIGQYRPVSIEEYELDYNLDRKLDQLNLKLLIPIDLSTIQIRSFNLILFFNYRLKSKLDLRMESIIHIQSQSWFNAKRIHLDGTLDLIQTNPFHHKGFDFRYNSSLISNSGEYIMIENDSNNKTVEQSFEFEKFLTLYYQRDYFTKFTERFMIWEPYMLGIANSIPKDQNRFQLDLTLHYHDQLFHYETGFWYLLKWALIQYLSIWIVVNWLVRKIENIVYGEYMVPSIATISDCKLLLELERKTF